jgi:hypothetical protein
MDERLEMEEDAMLELIRQEISELPTDELWQFAHGAFRVAKCEQNGYPPTTAGFDFFEAQDELIRRGELAPKKQRRNRWLMILSANNDARLDRRRNHCAEQAAHRHYQRRPVSALAPHSDLEGHSRENPP